MNPQGMLDEFKFAFMMKVLEQALKDNVPEAENGLNEIADTIEKYRNVSIERTTLFNDMLIAIQNRDFESVTASFSAIIKLNNTK